MTDNDQVRREMRDFVEESFLYMHPDLELTDDEDLLAKGVIDSLGFVELVEEVQSPLRRSRSRTSRSPKQNFGSINAIATFVERSAQGLIGQRAVASRAATNERGRSRSL